MTPREMQEKLKIVRTNLEGRFQPVDIPGTIGRAGIEHPPTNTQLKEAIEGLVEIVESMVAEREAERTQTSGF